MTKKRRALMAVAIVGVICTVPLASALRAEQLPFKSKILASGRVVFHADVMTHYWVIDFDQRRNNLRADLEREVGHLWPTWDGPFCKVKALACVMIVDHPQSRMFAEASGGIRDARLGRRYASELVTAGKVSPRHGVQRVVIVQSSRKTPSERFLDHFRRLFGREVRMTAEDFEGADRMPVDIGRRGQL